MKTENVTYEVVATKIRDLLVCGEKLTVRNVLNLTGGSSSKIMAYLKRWHDEQKLITQNTISEELLGTIAKEYAKAEAKAAEFYQNKVTNLETLLVDAMRCNAEYEDKLHQATKISEELATAKVEIASLESNLASLDEENRRANNNIGKLEQKLSDNEYNLAEALAGCHQLRSKLDGEKDQHKESVLSGVVLQAKHEQLQKQMNAIIKQIGKK
jgi:chromosome segregation ATPase